MDQETVYSLLALHLRRIFEKSGIHMDDLQEIRLRAERPLLIKIHGLECGLSEEGRVLGKTEHAHEVRMPGESAPVDENESACIVTKAEIEETLEYISGYSLYAFAEEIRQGFLTVPGGHRVGVAGKVVTEGDQITCLRHISFINIRLAHQIPGCADPVLPYLISDGQLCSTLIISPPGCGKTTLLRDLIRQISNGSRVLPGMTVGVVDERSEIAGSYLGIPQNDVGIRTDVLDCCPKSRGMMMLLRSMSPQVIAVDEIGGGDDVVALLRVRSCGCRLIASMHGDSFADASGRLSADGILAAGMFQRFLVLGKDPVGRIREIRNSEGTVLYPGEEKF